MSRHLGFPDQHHLDAAIGWLMLENPAEAKLEVDRVSLLGRLRPEAMVLRWQILARLTRWEQARHVAEVCTRICPSQAAGWLCLAYSLYRLDHPNEALEVLRARISLFPRMRGLPYLLACFASKAGLREEADVWLARSAAMGGPSEIKHGPLEADDLALSSSAPALDRAAANVDNPSRRTQLGKS
jgi:predicted Zn-dependent protease